MTDLELGISIIALQNIIEERARKHKPRAELRRRLELLRALQITTEQHGEAA